MYNEIYKIQQILNDNLENDRIVLELEDIENIFHSIELLEDFVWDSYYTVDKYMTKLNEIKMYLCHDKNNMSFGEKMDRLAKYEELKKKLFKIRQKKAKEWAEEIERTEDK